MTAAPDDVGEARTILVVDDERLVRELTVQVLEHAGYDVIAAATPHRALELVDRLDVDLVVSDIVMPRMSGVELLGEIRVRRPDLPVVLMTAEAAHAAAGVPPGASGIVYKPFSHAELRVAVEAAFAARRPAARLRPPSRQRP